MQSERQQAGTPRTRSVDRHSGGNHTNMIMGVYGAMDETKGLLEEGNNLGNIKV